MSVRQPLWPGDVNALLSACDTSREKLAVLALLETGMTALELSRLTSRDIEWPEGTIRTKGSLAVRRLSQELLELFRDHLDSRVGLGIGNRQIQRIVKAVGIRAGLSAEITPDILRRTGLWTVFPGSPTATEVHDILLEAAKAASDIILVADDERRFVDVNRAAASAFGLPREAIIGRTIDEFFEEANNQLIPDAWAGFLVEGEQRGMCRLRLTGHSTYEYRARANFVPGLHVSVLRPLNVVEKIGDTDAAPKNVECP